MNKIITTILLTATLYSCDINTPIGYEKKPVCDCVTTLQIKDLNNEWDKMPFSIDVYGDWCALDGDTTYYLEGENRTITTCK